MNAADPEGAPAPPLPGAAPASAATSSAAETSPGAPRRAAAVPLAGAAALLVAIAVAYIPALHAPFVYDDRIEVVGNRTIRALTDPAAIVTYNTSRPLLTLTYALNWAFGALDPFSYHLANIALHMGNTLLAWRLALRLLSPRRAALLAATWALHPMATEAVTYIAGRSDSLEATWWLVALTAWIDRTRGARGARLVAYAAVVAALLTKEVGLLLPMALLAVDRWAAPGGARRDHAPIWIAGVLALALRLTVYGWPAPEVPRDALAQALSQAEGWTLQARLWLVPIGQSIQHDLPGVARLSGAFALGAWALLVAVVVYGARGAVPGSPRALRALGLALFATFLLPASLVPLLETMAEHRSYLSGLGLLLAVVASVPVPRATWLLPALLFVGTFAQNRLWADDVTLWAAAVERNPASARANYGHAEALLRARRHAEAATAFEAVTTLEPTNVNAWLNLGIARIETHLPTEARAAWGRALQLDPRSCPAHNNLGRLALQAGDLARAASEYAATLAWCPDDPLAHLNLADLAWQRTDSREAAFHYKEYLRVAEDGTSAPTVRARLERLGVR